MGSVRVVQPRSHWDHVFLLEALELAIWIGMATSGLAFWELCYALFGYFVVEHRLPGWTSLMSVNAFLF